MRVLGFRGVARSERGLTIRHVIRHVGLLCGPAAALGMAVGVEVLGRMIPGYDPVRQTVSEIGEIGSPVQVSFSLLLFATAACLLGFAGSVWSASKARAHGRGAAYLIAFMAFAAVGIGLFPFPRPMHNVFGLSELIGYQAPLALALAWRGDVQARPLVRLSWIFLVLIWASIVLNLSAVFRPEPVWTTLAPVYGLVQRSLFAAWFGWCAGTGLLLHWMAGGTAPAKASA